MKKLKSKNNIFFAAMMVFSLSACTGLIPGVPYDGLNVYALAKKVAAAASHYDKTVTTDSLIEKTAAYSNALTSQKEEDAVRANFNDLTLLLYQAFKDVTPEPVGARTFQGSPYRYGVIAPASGLEEKSAAALQWLASLGLIADSAVYSVDAILKESGVNQMIDRFHAYLGQSYVDDFFATVNHDYLYDDCEIAYADPIGETTIYDSRMIPQSHINEWAKSFFDVSASAKNFNDSFMDADSRIDGKLAGLRSLIDQYLAATTIDQFVQIMQQEVINTGYCPLWSSIEFANESLSNGEEVFHKKIASCNCFSSDQSSHVYKEGYGSVDDTDDSYVRSVARFTPIFQEGLAISETEAEKWAKNYTHFKYLFCHEREVYESQSGIGIFSGESDVMLGSTSLPVFLNNCGIREPKWFTWSSSNYIWALLSLFSSEENLPYLKGFIIWQLFAHYTSCLPAGEAISKWAFSGRYSTNAEGLKNDNLWGSYCLPHISGLIFDSYQKSEGYADDIAAYVKVLDDLKVVMNQRIQSENWLSDEAKEAAAKKLETLRYSIGGTNNDGSYLTYSGPVYQEDVGLYANLAIEEDAAFDAGAATIGQDFDPATETEDFFDYCQDKDPLTANAFYMPSENGINIYTGYIAAYDDPTTTDKETFLATIGHTMAHELSHAFDNNGMFFDENGTYNRNLISEDDYNEFANRVAYVAESYNGYEVMPGQKTDGYTVVGEAIADITGLTLCLDMAKDISNFDYQKFFIEGAADMGGYASQRTYIDILSPDSHPFGRGRVNTCYRLFDEFHNAFNVQEDDGMYLSPEKRVKVW